MRRPVLAAQLLVVLLLAACTSPTPPAATTPPVPTTAPAALPSTGSTLEVASLRVPRAVHTATALPDGRVLVAGGCTTDGCGGTPEGGRAEIFDPASRRFEPGPAMVRPRAGHTATALLDGRVLITGGYPDEGRPPLSSVEVFDPRRVTFTELAPMRTGRGAHTATRLRDGRVLIVGGVDGLDALSTVEIFDPTRNAWGAAASLPGPRSTHGAALLADGRVLVVGGQSGAGHGNDLLDSVLVYDPARDRWDEVDRLAVPTYKLAVAALADGGAIVIGGQTRDDPAARLATTLLFDPSTGRFRPGPTMSEPRYKISDAVVTRPDGTIVIAGGRGFDVYAAGRLARVAGGGDVERQFPAAAVLGDGTVLVTGGYDNRTRVTASAVLVRPI
jgi:hypothetical protein